MIVNNQRSIAGTLNVECISGYIFGGLIDSIGYIEGHSAYIYVCCPYFSTDYIVVGSRRSVNGRCNVWISLLITYTIDNVPIR